MTFKALSNIIKKHKEQPIQLARQQEQEMVEAKAFMNTLYGKHIRAYQERKQKWFKEHPEKQYFEPTLEEVRRGT